MICIEIEFWLVIKKGKTKWNILELMSRRGKKKNDICQVKFMKYEKHDNDNQLKMIKLSVYVYDVINGKNELIPDSTISL